MSMGLALHFKQMPKHFRSQRAPETFALAADARRSAADVPADDSTSDGSSKTVKTSLLAHHMRAFERSQGRSIGEIVKAAKENQR